MTRRVIETSKVVGWPAVGAGIVIVAFGAVVMASEDVSIWMILGWCAIGLFVTGGLAASQMGYGPRLERRPPKP